MIIKVGSTGSKLEGWYSKKSNGAKARKGKFVAKIYFLVLLYCNAF